MQEHEPKPWGSDDRERRQGREQGGSPAALAVVSTGVPCFGLTRDPLGKPPKENYTYRDTLSRVGPDTGHLKVGATSLRECVDLGFRGSGFRVLGFRV